MELLNTVEKNHVTHRGMLAYIGVPIGIISIIISLVMVIVSSNFGSLNQNLMVSKQRNDYQDQRLTITEIADAAMKGDLAVIKEKISSIDKSLVTMADSISRIESRK